MPVTRNQINFVRELHTKKGRTQHNMFIAQGDKCVLELLHSDYKIEFMFASESWIGANKSAFKSHHITPIAVSDNVLQRMSTQTTAHNVVVVAKQPPANFEFSELQNKFVLVCDGINDPGNLGTIIRLADWFGIEKIFCSPDTCEAFNPKVVQAAMGSLFRIQCVYTHLSAFIANYKSVTHQPVYVAHTEGEPVFTGKFSNHAALVIGSESHGVSGLIMELADTKVTISQQSRHMKAESLNAGVAAAIVLSQILGHSNAVR